MILKFMSIETGGVHPLAKEPDIDLDTELSFRSNVKMGFIGDHIVLVLAYLHNDWGPEGDEIYLVDWKQGRVTLVSHILYTIRIRHPRTTPQGT
jgi:hypothetical protein